MEPSNTPPSPAVITKSTHLLAFQFSIVGLIIIENCLLLIPIVANRNRFWSSYFYGLLSSITSSILFAIIAMPVSILFGNSQQQILHSVLSCKTWSVMSHLLWDASILSVIYLNAGLIFSFMRPQIYSKKSCQLLIKFALVLSWFCSLIVNILLVAISSLKTTHVNPIQPCLHVASRDHFFVSSICGLILMILSFALYSVFASNIDTSRIGHKLACCIFPLLLLDGFMTCLRVIPEILHLIMFLKPNLFVNSLDEKYLAELLEFISWTTLFLLPAFWMLDPKVRQLFKKTFTRSTRSSERENTHSPSPEDEEDNN